MKQDSQNSETLIFKTQYFTSYSNWSVSNDYVKKLNANFNSLHNAWKHRNYVEIKVPSTGKQSDRMLIVT